MHWLQRKKPELISMDYFWKNATWLSEKSKKIDPFLQFFQIFSKMVHNTWLVSVELKSVDHDTS